MGLPISCCEISGFSFWHVVQPTQVIVSSDLAISHVSHPPGLCVVP